MNFNDFGTRFKSNSILSKIDSEFYPIEDKVYQIFNEDVIKKQKDYNEIYNIKNDSFIMPIGDIYFNGEFGGIIFDKRMCNVLPIDIPFLEININKLISNIYYIKKCIKDLSENKIVAKKIEYEDIYYNDNILILGTDNYYFNDELSIYECYIETTKSFCTAILKWILGFSEAVSIEVANNNTLFKLYQDALSGDISSLQGFIIYLAKQLSKIYSKNFAYIEDYKVIKPIINAGK